MGKGRYYGAESVAVTLQGSRDNTGVAANAGKNGSGIWTVVDRDSAPAIAKGVTATADGTLVVHMADNPAGAWSKLGLVANQPYGAIFDQVDVTNSTAGLFSADVTLFWLI